MIETYEKQPKDFSAKVHVAATYVNWNGKVLLLKIAPNKQEGGAWGVPAGKLELNEQPSHGAKRELFEETGLDISIGLFQSLGVLYFRKPEIDYVYHLFGVSLDTEPSIHVSKEHTTHQWVTRSEAENLPLMKGGPEALTAYFQRFEGSKYML